eukprot:COSAG06_NODE_45530_length_354_cov_0.611765_1_plen_26_part_01
MACPVHGIAKLRSIQRGRFEFESTAP